MGTTAEKLTYLNTTKGKIKDGINNLGGNITSETTFREYVTELDNIYSKLPKVSGSGTSLSLTPTLKGKITSTLKGNTLQNGTPTPSSPIPVNNVSGDNDIVVCGKNLFDKSTIIEGKYINASGNFVNDTNNFIGDIIGIDNTKTYYLNASTANGKRIAYYDSSQTFISRELFSALGSTLTIPNNAKYLRLSCYNQDLNTLQLKVGNQATTYEAYNGTTYPINLGELKGRGTIYNYSFNASSFTESSSNRTLCVPIKENTTYYISKSMVSNLFRICLSNDVPSSSSASVNEYSDKSSTTSTSITNTTYKYLNIFYWTNSDTYTEQQIYDSLSVYTTTPIELNKIGTYQDYFYKDSGKWYLHKETKKVVLNGSENITNPSNTGYSNTILRFNITVVDKKYGESGTIVDDILSDNFTCKKLDYDARTIESISGHSAEHIVIIFIDKSRLSTGNIQGFKTWLSTNNTSVYYVLETPTNTEITYTPLIEQLDELENAKSKEGTTNINQVNNDLGFIIDASALKGNEA